MRDDTTASGYKVLARAYRPQRLSELVGQDALVRTLTNAFASNRLAHAFLLTGIRGVGKTTTARIIAKALNCEGPDGKGGPTPEPCGVCTPCRSIEAQNAIDVIELDAATHTGVDNMRDLLASVRYGPTALRTKVYIVDEVHMLSGSAFAALLKTLEEPPAHTKFVFATTEQRKVPVTIVSRCQRFDLKRVPPDLLAGHLAAICVKEQVEAEADALALIARIAEGSVRDSLSLLDQAIALGSGKVVAAEVADMLGLADRGRLLDLLEPLLTQQPKQALDVFAELHARGADPIAVIQDLLGACHWLSRLKLDRHADPGWHTGRDGHARGVALAGRIGLPAAARAWQVLLRGLDEVKIAADGAMAAEMLLLRLACLAELPPPAELLRKLERLGGTGPAPAGGPTPARPELMPAGPVANLTERGAPPAAAAPLVVAAAALRPIPAEPASSSPPAGDGGFADFAAMTDFLRNRGEPMLASMLETGVHLVRMSPQRLEIRPEPGVRPDLASLLQDALHRTTGRRWMVAIVNERGAATLAEQRAAERDRLIAELSEDPAIRRILDAFPGATIEDVRPAPAQTPFQPIDEPDKRIERA
ncbi:MAG TPA: DNA polymerase III subunit gamma/tau [Geminicoccus sp.]|jgi:DNA polymerase-3 subunit gamma/tau|uniref:DNA polymerase III subunit gamma/tau n=1 Tax=Geminicoccus sp. TaxID=2024832 RepID=UPI002E34A9EB|nr:DNA polymerase III subunit gamma/tau [Geminicoccus sp.]HEX2525077.1 DNA polymerase III subunit gamma/tau [Geminicoccus sp.]